AYRPDQRLRAFRGGRGKKLILAGGRATLLHQIFQRTGVMPGKVWNAPHGERAFCLASMMVQLEQEQKAGEEGTNGL
uniref:hypothetical protein n=1 Tax=Gemmiger formicilis TaxID=745368 RepID=UPI003FED7D8C